jgi:tetratricopeptide (TPR) repeat protein
VEDYNKLQQAVLWTKEAVHRQQRGEFDRAHEILEKASKVYRELAIPSALAIALSQLSVVCMLQNQLQPALDYIKESIDIRTKLYEYSNLSGDYQQLGNIAMQVGQYSFAMQNYQESLRLAMSLKDASRDSRIASAESCIGLVYFYQDRFSEAKPHFIKSQELRRRLKDEIGMAKNSNHLGRIAEEEKNYKEAAKLFEESWKILQKLKAFEATTALDNLNRVKKFV